MKTHYFFIPFAIFSLTSCNSHSQDNSSEEKKLTTVNACDICLLQDELENYQMAKVSGIPLKKSQQYFDSITVKIDSIQKIIDQQIETYRIENNLNTTLIANNSVWHTCIDSFAFGTNLSPEMKDSVFTYLYDEMYMMNSGFGISYKKAITNLTPKTDEKGQMYTYITGEKVVISNLKIWKEEEIEKWNIWMARIDLYIIDLTGKKYERLSPIEQVILETTIKLYK